LVYRRGSAGKNQPLGFAGKDLLGWRIEREDFTVNACFSDSAGYELRVLGSEVKYDYCFVVRISRQANLS